MTQWLRQITPVSSEAEISGYEDLLPRIVPPVDENTIETTNIRVLAALLGGQPQIAANLLSCLGTNDELF